MSVRENIAKKLSVIPEQVQMGISERWVRLASAWEGTHKKTLSACRVIVCASLLALYAVFKLLLGCVLISGQTLIFTQVYDRLHTKDHQPK